MIAYGRSLEPFHGCILQRDYFGAHTFKVLPGKENSRLKAGEDIREHFVLPFLSYADFLVDVNWTGRGGNVSSSAYTA